MTGSPTETVHVPYDTHQDIFFTMPNLTSTNSLSLNDAKQLLPIVHEEAMLNNAHAKAHSLPEELNVASQAADVAESNQFSQPGNYNFLATSNLVPPSAIIVEPATRSVDASGTHPVSLPQVASPSIVTAEIPSDELLTRPSFGDRAAQARSRRTEKLEVIHGICDAFEIPLERGEAFLPLSLTTGDIHYNRLAEFMGCAREDLRIPSVRERLVAWREKYGLSRVKRERGSGPITVDELGKLMVSERKRQLKEEERADTKTRQKCAASMSNMRWALHAVSERFAGSADARASVEAMIKLADAGEVNGEKKLREEMQRGLKLLDDIEANGGLPSDASDLIQFAMDRAGVKDADVVRDLGFHRPYIWGWRTGKKNPSPFAYAECTALERYLHLPEGAILARSRQRWRGLGHVPLDLFPEEFRSRAKRALRGEMLKYLSPEDFVQDDALRHANIRRVADELMLNPSKYGGVIQRLAKMRYRWGEDEWMQEEINAEWEALVRFRTSLVAPPNMKRKGKRWRAGTVDILRENFSTIFGTWSSIANPIFTIDPRDISFAYLLFPSLIHHRLTVAVEWSKEAGGDEVLPNFDLQNLSHIRAFLHPDTGWITQSAHLGSRLVPVVGKNGDVIVSQEDIDRVNANWKEECKKARDEHGELRRSHAKCERRNRDPQEPVFSILELENPLVAFQMLSSGLQNETVEYRSYAQACLIRDQVLVGILTLCAPRGKTIIDANVEHLVYDEKRKVWMFRIPREFFKNERGPYFKSPNGEVRDYARDLFDQYGLYDAIEQYFAWARDVILAGNKTDALIVSAPRRERKGRGLKKTTEKGRFIREGLRSVLHRITARHVGYKPQTGAGIKGVTHFGAHAFRHILATGVLKLAMGAGTGNPWLLAADAIHDSEAVVRKHYARHVPRDREQSLMTTIQLGFAAKAA